MYTCLNVKLLDISCTGSLLLLINATSLDPDQGGPNENYIQHLIEYLTAQKTRMTLLSSADFFKNFFLDPQLLAKVISRQQKSPLARTDI